jgi:hypothetical protein
MTTPPPASAAGTTSGAADARAHPLFPSPSLFECFSALSSIPVDGIQALFAVGSRHGVTAPGTPAFCRQPATFGQ